MPRSTPGGTCPVTWNESHWSDPEFDALVAQINSELDRDTRADLYRQAQRIMVERGPVIVPFFQTAAAGVSATVDGVELAPDWSRPVSHRPLREVTEKI